MKLNKNINQVINNYFNWCSLIRYEFNKKKKLIMIHLQNYEIVQLNIKKKNLSIYIFNIVDILL